MRPLSSRPFVIVLLTGLACAGAAEAQVRAGGGGPVVSPLLGRGGLGRSTFGPGRSPVMAGDVLSGAGPSAFQRRAFGYGTLLGRGVAAPFGFGGYGYGGFGGLGGIASLPLAGGVLDPFGIPLDAGAPPPPSFPVVSHADHGPSLVGIAPSPMKPPAIYVIGGDRRSARVRAGAVTMAAEPARPAEGTVSVAPRIVTVGPNRS